MAGKLQVEDPLELRMRQIPAGPLFLLQPACRPFVAYQQLGEGS